MQKLLIEDDEGKSVAVPLIRDEITIGRQEGNTIRLSEQNVSRRHARLVRRQGVLMLEDLSSYNGTKLNGTFLTASASLKDGDVFLIGDYRMAIKEDRASAGVQAISKPAPPEVRDELEAQPTIPLQAQPEPVAPVAAAPPARLVVVGKFMAGREFVLDRPSLVIGRTPENDIVIEHKSISRHHARIVCEDGQYSALDLESANGVRVNGVDHHRVQLRPGDEIELGQVLLRFVTDDGGGYGEAALASQRKRKLFMMVGGGAAALALILIFALSGDKSQPKPSPSVVTKPTPVPALPPPPPKEPLPDLMAAAKAAQQSENWDEVLKIMGKAVADYPEAAEAAELRKLAESEKGNAERFASLKQAAESVDFETVARSAAEITEGSLYKERATTLEKSTRAEYITLHYDTAFAKAKTGECDTAKQEAELVLAVDTGNKQARSIILRCSALAKRLAAQGEAMKKPAAALKPALVQAPVPAPAPKPVVAAKPKQPLGRTPAESSTPVEAVDPEKLIQQARDAWLRGQYAVAIDAARRALRAKPGLSSAYQIIAICSCSLHDPDTALRAYEKLDERNKQLVRSACQKNGISF